MFVRVRPWLLYFNGGQIKNDTMRKEKLQVEEESLSERLIKYVTTREDEDFAGLSVTSLARRFNIDRFKLSRTFKAEKKMTLDYYLLQEKMFRCAFILMSDRGITVKELARIMGFCTCDYFIQVFKKYFGIVPGQYKEFKTQRSGLADRRIGLPDRRVNANGPIPKSGDRRLGSKARRMGPGERRIPAPEETLGTDSVDDDPIMDHSIGQGEREKRE